MKAWLCENPIGPEALVWKDIADARAEGRPKCASRFAPRA